MANKTTLTCSSTPSKPRRTNPSCSGHLELQALPPTPSLKSTRAKPARANQRQADWRFQSVKAESGRDRHGSDLQGMAFDTRRPSVRGVARTSHKWGGWVSNPRPRDYESHALTTELPPLNYNRVPHVGPCCVGSGGRARTCDPLINSQMLLPAELPRIDKPKRYRLDHRLPTPRLTPRRMPTQVSSFAVEKLLQALRTLRMAQLRQCLRLDLTNSFSRNIELCANLLKRSCLGAANAVTHADDLGLAD